MTAGNYWGRRSVSGVALSLSGVFNFFNRNPRVFPEAESICDEAASLIRSGNFASLC